MDLMETKIPTSITLKLKDREFLKTKPRGWLNEKIRGLIDDERNKQQSEQL